MTDAVILRYELVCCSRQRVERVVVSWCRSLDVVNGVVQKLGECLYVKGMQPVPEPFMQVRCKAG